MTTLQAQRRHRTPKYCVQDQWIVLQEPAEVTVVTAGGRKQTFHADCWGHPDGKTLRIYRDGFLLAIFREGKWPGGCYSFGYRKEQPLAVAEAQQEGTI